MPNKPKKEKRLTVLGERLNGLRGDVSQAEFAKRIGLTAATVGYYENSERLPDAETLHKICVACDCTSDYLLGLSDVKNHDIDAQAASKRYGLSEVPLYKLSDMPTTEESFGTEHATAMSRRADTMTFRAIINLLLSNPHGHEALKLLASYYFAIPDGTRQNLPAFVLPWEVDKGQIYNSFATLSDELQRETLLELAKAELKALRTVLNADEFIYPNYYSYTKASKETAIKEQQAIYDARNPHKNKGSFLLGTGQYQQGDEHGGNDKE